jgi:predicted permease
MAGLLHDIRFAVRTLMRQPGFTLAAVIALALGIGGNTAIFSALRALVLMPPPFAQPDRLVLLFSEQHEMNLRRASSSQPDYSDWRRMSKSFVEMGAVQSASFNLSGEHEPERLTASAMTASCLRTLGAQPIVGRWFEDAEEVDGRNRVVLLGYKLWQRRFAADRNIAGKTILLNREKYTVAGVMPPQFAFPEESQIWVPFRAKDTDDQQRGEHNLTVVARLREGVTVQQAQAEMSALAARIAKGREMNAGWSVLVTPLSEELVRDTKPLLVILMGAVTFVLLIACANVANLLLARMSGRHREIAIRAALGAGRWRLIRQLLTESMLLSLAGGALGLLPALWGVDLLRRAYPPEQLPRMELIRIDSGVLLFTVLVSMVTGVLFGLAPALASVRKDLNDTLKQHARALTSGGWLRSALVVGEVAVSLMLLAGAALLMEAFLRIRTVEPGFNPSGLLTMRVSLPPQQYTTEGHQRAFTDSVLQRIVSVPGVEHAAITTNIPFGGNDSGQVVVPMDRPDPPPNNIPVIFYRIVTPDYLHVLQLPLKRGRFIEPSDTETSEPVIVINEKAAQQYWPGLDPVGRMVRFGRGKQNPSARIIGVVGSVYHRGLTDEVVAEMYVPYRQRPQRELTVVLRTRLKPENLVPAARAELRKVDPGLPIFDVRTVEAMIDLSMADRRVTTMTFGIFAALALLLAVVGIYGVMSYTVAQRTAELGIRIAIGATPRNVIALVVRQGLALSLAGVAIGMAGAWLVGRFLEDMLFGVKPSASAGFFGVPLLLLTVALIANFLPARRAATVDPVIALRQ